MSDLDQLYQQLILDHAKHPHGQPMAADASLPTAHLKNPICGDEITLRPLVEGERLVAVTWEGAGCSISQASASMLASLVAEEGGLSREDAARLIADFREALRSRGQIALSEEEFGDAAALSGVSRFTARVKCAMLAWVALEETLGA